MNNVDINSVNTTAIINAGLARRHAAEQRFKWYGLIAISLGLLFVAILFIDIISKGYPAFMQTYIQLDIKFDPQEIDPEGNRDPDVLSRANYDALIRDALTTEFPDVSGRREKRALYRLVSSGGSFQLRAMVLENPDLLGTRSH